MHLVLSYKTIIARSAFYVLCVLDRLRSMSVVCMYGFFWQSATGQQGGDRAVGPWCFERNDQKFSKITVFGPVSNQVQEQYIVPSGPKNGHFSLFLTSFKSSPGTVYWSKWTKKWTLFIVFGPVSNQVQEQYIGFRGPKNGHFSLFLDQFQTRLSLHISGLEGLEMGTFLVWGASRPCSAECCLVIS